MAVDTAPFSHAYLEAKTDVGDKVGRQVVERPNQQRTPSTCCEAHTAARLVLPTEAGVRPASLAGVHGESGCGVDCGCWCWCHRCCPSCCWRSCCSGCSPARASCSAASACHTTKRGFVCGSGVACIRAPAPGLRSIEHDPGYWWTSVAFTCCERCSASAPVAFVASSSPILDCSNAALRPPSAAASTGEALQLTNISTLQSKQHHDGHCFGAKEQARRTGSIGSGPCGIRLCGGGRRLQSGALRLQLCADSLQRLRSRLGSVVCCQQRLQNTEAQCLASGMSVLANND
jgi:hypothetical protein